MAFDRKVVNLVLKGKDEASKVFSRPIRSLKDLKDIANRVKGPLATAGLAATAAFAGMSTAAAEEMRKVEVAMTAATGSTAAAAAEMGFTRDIADSLGLELFTTARGYSKLAAAAQGTALAGKDTRDVFEAVATAASGLSLSADQTHGALTAIEQMISKGKVSAEELRQQLGERLPGAFQIAARSMGVSTQELDKMLSTGKLLAEDFLPKFATELKSTFGGAAATNSKSLTANIARLKNAFTDVKVAVGNDLLPVVTKFAAAMTESEGGVNALKTATEGLRGVFRGLVREAVFVASTLESVGLISQKLGLLFENIKLQSKFAFGAIDGGDYMSQLKVIEQGWWSTSKALEKVGEEMQKAVSDPSFFDKMTPGGDAAKISADGKTAVAAVLGGEPDAIAAEADRFMRSITDKYAELHLTKEELLEREISGEKRKANNLIENELWLKGTLWTIEENAKAKRKELLDEEIKEHNALMDKKARIADQKSKEMARLEERRNRQRVQGMRQMFGGMLSLAETFGGRHTAIFKGFAVAEALMNTYAGASRAFRDWPYPISLGVAGIVTAQGLAQVAQISSMGSAHAGIDSVPQDQTIVVQRGERIIRRDQNEDITAALTEGGGRGGVPETIVVRVELDGRQLGESIVDLKRDGFLPS